MNKDILRKVIYVGLFLIPFVPFLVSSSLFFPFITTKAFTWRIIVEVIFAAWIILAIIAPEFRPRKSPILYAFAAFLLIVGIADIFGMAPMKSFWSNFERMEGYIALIHLGAMFLIMGSVLREREWKWWWNTSLAASALMVFYCLFQLLGAAEIHQGGARVDGTLGNAAYLALYFLIHIFIAIYYFVRSKGTLRWTYGILILAQVAILYFTATRGAILGLLGGLIIIGILNLTNKENIRARKWSMYLLGVLAALVVGFFLLRNTGFIKNSPVLARFATISLSQWKSEGRSFVWAMALQGVKEKPILGWGQDNFNYVFAEHYSPQMYRLEPWFDRAHNIFLDWGVSAGVLGLGAYLSLYIVLLMAIWKRDSSLGRLERSILTGLIAAYFFNNFFVFDNLVSYVLFVALLAQVHERTAKLREGELVSDESKALLWSVPVAAALLLIIYFANVKPIMANVSLINALQTAQGAAGGRAEAIGHFEKAYNASRLGRPEVVEWISSTAPAILGDESIPFDTRNAYFNFATNAVEDMTKTLKDDPRYELVAGTYYSSVGAWDQALAHLERAKTLMPEKQQIYFSLGQALYYKKDYKASLEAFKHAYDLAPEFDQAKNIYEAALREIPH
ncbi:O-antigen ligase family protein [Candidatus Parcubacteria bacterium]|nr:O-antigen ligase family protein [Candidatus Parcubacteria bacterium]